MPIPGLPKLERCCWCTKKLRVACLLIVVCCMFQISHSLEILLWPACPDQYKEDSSSVYKSLVVFKWMLFIICMFTATSSFFLLLGLLLKKYLSITADVFMGFVLVTALLSFIHGSITIKYYVEQECTNPSDIIVFYLYCFLWCYFILIINTYAEQSTAET